MSALSNEVDWEAVYRDLYPRVYNFFRFRGSDGLLAEDLTSTTFEQAWSSRGRYHRDVGSFSAWLFGIARHVAAHYFRERREALAGDDRYGQMRADPPSGSLPDRSTEDAAQRRQDFARLSAILSGLPERERDLVALKYGAGLTNRAIAGLTGLSESNVGTILHRVVTRIRAELGEDSSGR